MSADNIQSDENNSASDRAGEDGPKHVPAPHQHSIWGRIAEIAGGIILMALADVAFDSNFHRLGDGLMFLALLCGIHVVSNLCKTAGFKNVNRWSIVSVIFAALFIICFSHGPETPGSKKSYMLSKPDAEDIIGKFKDSIPMQQSSVANGFVGLSIIWKLHLTKATEDQGMVHLVLISSYDGAAISNIRMDVPEKGHEFLKVANRNDAFIVKSEIQRASDSGIDLVAGGTILPAN